MLAKLHAGMGLPVPSTLLKDRVVGERLVAVAAARSSRPGGAMPPPPPPLRRAEEEESEGEEEEEEEEEEEDEEDQPGPARGRRVVANPPKYRFCCNVVRW